MSEERLVDLLARREEEPGRSLEGLDDLDSGLRRALSACSSLERQLSTLALLSEGHPERAGPWVLLRPLGRGPAGTVYLAEREDGGGRTAVRLWTGLDGPDLRETARRAAGWTHEGLVPVLETGDDWVATEVSGGVPLSGVLAALRRDPTADPAETTAPLLRALGSVARALEEGHARGLVHAGVSPRKVDLTGDGRLRIRDFGHDPTRAGRPPTPEAPPLGPPHHLAPEQAGDSAEVGPATDRYSFASVVWTVAAGHAPFQARSLTALLRRIREDPPPPLPEGALPEDVAEVVLACLAKRPEDRPETLPTVFESR